jgi:hypothetical protein
MAIGPPTVAGDAVAVGGTLAASVALAVGVALGGAVGDSVAVMLAVEDGRTVADAVAVTVGTNVGVGVAWPPPLPAQPATQIHSTARAAAGCPGAQPQRTATPRTILVIAR